MKHTTMKHRMIAGLAVLVTSLAVQSAEPKTGPNTTAAEKTNPASQWRSQPPADCPFKPSASLTGIEFTGRHSDYRCGDTFYPSWASDGNLYSPWTDGKTDGDDCQSWQVPAKTGHAVMKGDDPLKLEIHNTSPPKVGASAPYTGRYPAGSLVHNGIWYYGMYMPDFGEQGYFLNFPSKFISPDGQSLWLCYSANFSTGWNGVKLNFNPPGGRYGLCLHEVRLLSPHSSKTD
ncbi:MAG: hypothetical protein K9N23_18105 [Akkermansiaceae bacterium]|nr:hypothetical protein [Akkermansiaceae bacterium]